MNYEMYSSSVKAMCLFFVIFFTGCPISTASGYSLQHELEQSQIEALLSQFVRSRGGEGDGDWTELEELGHRWNEDRSQNKRREHIRLRNNGCNPITGRCSAGWKRSPSGPRLTLESLQGAEFDTRSIDLPQAVSSPYHAAKRDTTRPLYSGRRRNGGKSYQRSLRGKSCNKFNGRCSAGWKRSPMPLGVGQSGIGGDINRREENVFDVLERLENDDYRQRLQDISI